MDLGRYPDAFSSPNVEGRLIRDSSLDSRKTCQWHRKRRGIIWIVSGEFKQAAHNRTKGRLNQQECVKRPTANALWDYASLAFAVDVLKKLASRPPACTGRRPEPSLGLNTAVPFTDGTGQCLLIQAQEPLESVDSTGFCV
jgi:hypothetical protein